MDKLIITSMTYDEMYEQAYERASEYAESEDLDRYDTDEALVHDFLDDVYYEEVYEIHSADDLKRWFLHNGGPNYKERLAEETNWGLILDAMLYGGKEKDSIFDAVVYTPTEAKLFVEDNLEDDEEDYEDDDQVLEEAHNGTRQIQELTFEEAEQLFGEILFNSVYMADYENTLGVNPAEVLIYADGYLEELLTDDEGKYLDDKAFEDIQLTAEGFYDYIQSFEV